MSTKWNNADLVFRQVHPHYWDGTNPNSQAFFPTPKDEDKLSVDDASVVTAEASWKHFTTNLGLASVGTWAVSFEEIESAHDLELTKNPVVDPNDATKNNPAHCLINFGKLTTKGQKKKRAQHLAIKASARGRQFTPPA